MNLTWPSKDPDEVLDYSWPVPLDDGDAISGTPSVTVIAGTVSLGAQSALSGKVTVVISGGQPSENAIVKMVAQTAGGRTFVEEFLLQINAAAAVPVAPTGKEDSGDIAADLVVLREARTKLAGGQRVEEVWRSGRRLTYGKVTLDQLNRLIAQRENDLAAVEASEAGNSRRRGIGLAWIN